MCHEKQNNITYKVVALVSVTESEPRILKMIIRTVNPFHGVSHFARFGLRIAGFFL